MAGSSSASAAAGALLRRQLKQMQTDKDIPGISCGLVSDKNIFEWEVMLMIGDDNRNYGGACLGCCLLILRPSYPRLSLPPPFLSSSPPALLPSCPPPLLTPPPPLTSVPPH